MSSEQHDHTVAFTARVQATRKATADWLKRNGEQLLFALGTGFMWSAAVHAAYLAAVPEPLRVPVAKRNQRVWKMLAVGSLVGVALYDAVHSAVLTEQQQQLASEAKKLRLDLQKYAEGL